MRFLLLVLLLAAAQANAFRPLPGTPADPKQPQNTPPEITCPASLTVSTDFFACSAALTFTVNVVDDQTGWVLSQTAGISSGGAFPLGVTVNQFTVVDAESNTATCSFTVTVQDLTPPTAICTEFLAVAFPTVDDPADCYDGQVAFIPSFAFDQGSYDNCGQPVKITLQRLAPYNDVVNGLNQLNGQVPCYDNFPDAPSEFERATGEAEELKIYCGERDVEQLIIVRVYQTNPDGSSATFPDGSPIVNSCITTLDIKNNGACVQNTARLNGRISIDADGNCVADNPSYGLGNQVVQLNGPGGNTLYTSTNEAGYYLFTSLDPGAHTLTVLPSLPNWNFCPVAGSVTIPVAPSETEYNIYAEPITDCPMMQINMATALMRPCSISTWTGRYCNLGGADATDAYVDLEIPENFTWQNASLPYTITGSTMRVQLGTVAPGACGVFQARVLVPCTAEIIGTRMCMDAHIFPDTLCAVQNAAWSGAQITLDATCTGDSVRFTLRNNGIVPTTQALDYVIIDDMVIMLEKTLPAGLEPGESITETIEALGHSYRLNAAQEPNHPAVFNPSVSVEDCNGVTTSSLLLEFANEDGNFFTDTECREVVGSYDPNEKLAFPKGFSDQHFIEPNTYLSYQLGFQNTGNDTAFLVILRDTLPSLLDPTTLRMTGSSHPFEYKLSQTGVLEVRFENILLVDSTTNEPDSHGFVQFDIAQKTDNPLGSVIENRAGIYFDVNPVVITNSVWHTIGQEFIPTVATNNPSSERQRLHIYPNPANGSSFVGLSKDQDMELRVLNLMGKEVQRYTGKAPGIQLRQNGLPAGMYWLEIRQNNHWVAAGKLIWKPE